MINVDGNVDSNQKSTFNLKNFIPNNPETNNESLKSLIYNNQSQKNENYLNLAKTRLKQNGNIDPSIDLYNQKKKRLSFILKGFLDKIEGIKKEKSQGKIELKRLNNFSKEENQSRKAYFQTKVINYSKISLKNLFDLSLSNNHNNKRPSGSFVMTNQHKIKSFRKSFIPEEKKNDEYDGFNVTIKKIINKINEIKHRINKKFR